MRELFGNRWRGGKRGRQDIVMLLFGVEVVV